MALAIALILITVASVVFHFVSPWWFTPLASNWSLIDDTITITFIITGVVFVAINLFLVWTVLRFRYRADRRAAYEPENKKLEGWLTVGTSLGIIAMLAPGLYVYADMINPPDDAEVVEAVGQQWQWRFRFPGEDGRFGRTHVRFIDSDNPFGLDPDDPLGHDDVLVNAADVRLPLERPVLVLLRAQDVLHSFHVPQIRVKVDLVPGMVSRFWFRPTMEGRFEILCAELCGVAHYNMRGHLEVVSEEAFREWLPAQPTFAATLAAIANDGMDESARHGRALAGEHGCVACHSSDGSASIGPTWKGLYGAQRPLADGTSVLADEDYLAASIRTPGAAIAQGFAPIMPRAELSDAEVGALVEYIKSLGAQGGRGEQSRKSDESNESDQSGTQRRNAGSSPPANLAQGATR